MISSDIEWSAYNVSCGLGMRNKTRCNKVEYQNCFSQMCAADPDCDKFEIDFDQSKVETRIDLNITLKRHEDIEKQIASQKIQVFHSKNPSNGVEKIWKMKAKNFTKAKSVTFKEEIESSICCKPSADNCTFQFKKLKLKSKYHVILMITLIDESRNVDNHNKSVISEVIECPQKDIMINLWRCDADQSIPAESVCDNKKDCTNGFDEHPKVCRGYRKLKIAFIAVLSLSGFSLFIALLNGWKHLEPEKQIRDEKQEKDKFSEFMNMSKVNETKDLEKDVLEKFQQLKVSVKIDVLNILLLVTTDKVMEFLKGIAITEKIMTAHGESNETLKAIRKIQEEKICAK